MRSDPISFYKFDPFSLRRLDGDRFDHHPIIRRVQVRDMLQPETFARYRLRPLRLHYQSVIANDRRAPYDYFMAICGPVLFAAWTTAPRGLLDSSIWTHQDGLSSRGRAVTLLIAKAVWCAGVVGRFIIRHPYARPLKRPRSDAAKVTERGSGS